jgi:membrane-bound lytic murein transglycosylase B
MRFALIAFVVAALAADATFAQRSSLLEHRKAADERRGTPYGARADVRAFAAEIARDTTLKQADVERWLASARFQPQIVALMQRPFVDPPKWFEYAPPFLSTERVAGGVAWWNANGDALARAEAKWGVPPEVIVAIVGVETYYGRVAGSYRVIDALATLAFDFPSGRTDRSAFFQD